MAKQTETDMKVGRFLQQQGEELELIEIISEHADTFCRIDKKRTGVIDVPEKVQFGDIGRDWNIILTESDYQGRKNSVFPEHIGNYCDNLTGDNTIRD